MIGDFPVTISDGAGRPVATYTANLPRLAIMAAIRRLAPRMKISHFAPKGMHMQEFLLQLISDPEMRERLGGPDTVSDYTRDLAVMPRDLIR